MNESEKDKHNFGCQDKMVYLMPMELYQLLDYQQYHWIHNPMANHLSIAMYHSCLNNIIQSNIHNVLLMICLIFYINQLLHLNQLQIWLLLNWHQYHYNIVVLHPMKLHQDLKYKQLFVVTMYFFFVVTYIVV